MKPATTVVQDKSMWGEGKVPGIDSADDGKADTKVSRWSSFFDHDIIKISPNTAVRLLDLQDLRRIDVHFMYPSNSTFAQCSAVHGQLSDCNVGTAKLPTGAAAVPDQDASVCDCHENYVDSFLFEKIVRY